MDLSTGKAREPAWGVMALERFLLEKWNLQDNNENSSETRGELRKRLVKEFLTMGRQARKPYTVEEHSAILSPDQLPARSPTEEQIDVILRPLRPSSQRLLAAATRLHPVVWLRVNYAEGSDNIHDELKAEFDLENLHVSEDYLVLDDASLYNFGDEINAWTRVFDTVPELSVNRANYDPELDVEIYNRNIKEAKQLITGEIQEAGGLAQLDQDEIIEVCSPAQIAAVNRYIFVVDAEAMDTHELLMAFIDDSGRIVRETRANYSEAVTFGGLWSSNSWDGHTSWSNADIGPQYLPGAACGPPYSAD